MYQGFILKIKAAEDLTALANLHAFKTHLSPSFRTFKDTESQLLKTLMLNSLCCSMATSAPLDLKKTRKTL